MEKRRTIRIALMMVLAAATAVPCSWDTTPAFTFRIRPDGPVEDYINGRIGIIRPEYARSHLVVAYRWLSGNALSADERAGFYDLIGHRLKELAPAGESAAKTWELERAMIRGINAGSPPYATRNAGGYSYITNCNDDAFLHATKVLRDRAARYGAKSEAVLSWLEAQETVFSNCSEGEAMPKPADASLPPLIRADRAYQLAAAKFYAMKYDDARAQFLAIAADGGSPWRQTARLVAARALLRKSTTEAGDDSSVNAYSHTVPPMEQAERDLRAILADASMAQFHDAARDLLAFADFRLHPQRRFNEAALALAKGSTSAKRDLDDYTLLWDLETLDDLKTSDGDDELTRWIKAFQSGADAMKEWRATKKQHWLVAALAAAKPDGAAELFEASKEIAADSPAYPSVAYHRARLLLATNHPDEARAELDRVLSLGEEKLPPGSRNLLLEQRRAVARSLAEYLRDAQTMPIGYDSEQWPEPFPSALIAEDAAAVLREDMPLAMLAEAAESKDLAASIRTPILIAAWTRAILLDREDVATRLAPAMIALVPGIEQRFNVWRAAGAKQRRFAAADLLVHYGALQPDVQPFGGRQATETDFESVSHGGGNWWCVGRVSATPHTTPPFLAEHALAASTERVALTELSHGTTYMLRTFLDAARTSPKDPRVPEALALAIQGARWACGDAGTDALAEEAFGLLHRKYPASKWAKETRYWYRSGY